MESTPAKNTETKKDTKLNAIKKNAVKRTESGQNQVNDHAHTHTRTHERTHARTHGRTHTNKQQPAHTSRNILTLVCALHCTVTQILRQKVNDINDYSDSIVKIVNFDSFALKQDTCGSIQTFYFN